MPDWSNAVFRIKSPTMSDDKHCKAKVLSFLQTHFGPDIEFLESSNQLDLKGKNEQLQKYLDFFNETKKSNTKTDITTHLQK